ncbi:OmpA family protein [Desertibaculum subflavum]|uniref:OmpA family protein n=1 Tax=Desertibaculum subflavum TaxID=2268458 RepID=UPI000E6703DD
MALRGSTASLFLIAVLLGGCSFASDVLWPSVSGDAPPAPPAQAAPPPASAPVQTAQVAAPPPAPSPAAGLQPTGTYVGQKVQQLRSELGQLEGVVNQRSAQLQLIRNATTENSQRYHGTVAAITTRLQLGTTPGNPVLVQQWNQAQADLDRISTDIAAMNSLANEVAADSALAAYLLDAARATYTLSGAIDEDHRQIAILEDQVNKAVVLIDRQLNELSEDISRQTTYVGNERANLTALSLSIKNGELYGGSLANRAYRAVGDPGAGPAVVGGGRAAVIAPDGRQPLVVIRFDQPNPPYQQALYTAVAKALERRPQAQFDLVAIASNQGANTGQAALNQNQSRRNAERVLRTLTDMGLPAGRISLSSTTSTQTPTNEVHVYVR